MSKKTDILDDDGPAYGLELPVMARAERELLVSIATRFVDVLSVPASERAIAIAAVAVVIGSVHRHVPLDLELLSVFRDLDLVHDVVGIREHWDRGRCVMRDGFVPRCAR